MSRIIVITGGTSGLGLELKNMFENNGDTVITFSNQEYNSPYHFEGNVSHEIKVRQVFNTIHERYGKIDMLINCAGCGMSGITELAPLEDIQKTMDVNFYGTLYCIRSALSFMEAGSKIINFSSAMALFPVPFRSIYGASKSAILNLSFSLRMELEPYGIDVIAVCPGDTKTNFTANRLKDYTTNSRYGDRLEVATNNSDSKENKRMSAKYVSSKIFKIINKTKSKPFYIIGNKYKLLYFLTRFTPKSLLLKATNSSRGGLSKTKEVTKVNKIAPSKENVSNSLTTEELHKLESLNKENINQKVTNVVETKVEPQIIEEKPIIEEKVEVLEEKETKPEEKVNKVIVEEKTKSIDEETAKKNISNFLSKINNLNKPSNEQENKEKDDERIIPTTNNVNNNRLNEAISRLNSNQDE